MRSHIVPALVLLGLGGCGSESGGKQAAPAPQEAPTPASVTAAGLADAFKKAGLPVGSIKVLDEASDDNHLLGRPGQYTSKVFFYDSRHPHQEGSDEGENTIEVFANEADAKARDDYIAGVTKGVPMVQQYRYLNGRALVRLDKVLLPWEAKQYDAALRFLVR